MAQRYAMTERQHISKSGDIWTWIETAETVKALQAYWNLVNGRSTQSY